MNQLHKTFWNIQPKGTSHLWIRHQWGEMPHRNWFWIVWEVTASALFSQGERVHRYVCLFLLRKADRQSPIKHMYTHAHNLLTRIQQHRDCIDPANVIWFQLLAILPSIFTFLSPSQLSAGLFMLHIQHGTWPCIFITCMVFMKENNGFYCVLRA